MEYGIKKEKILETGSRRFSYPVSGDDGAGNAAGETKV